MIDKLEKCIEFGKCPHVNAANPEAVAETSIHRLHLAAALGKTNDFENDNITRKIHVENGLFDIKTGLFRITTCELAIQRHNYKTAVFLINSTIFGYLCSFCQWFTPRKHVRVMYTPLNPTFI